MLKMFEQFKKLGCVVSVVVSLHFRRDRDVKNACLNELTEVIVKRKVV